MWQNSSRVAGLFLLACAWRSKAALTELNEVVYPSIRHKSAPELKDYQAISSARESYTSDRKIQSPSFHSEEWEGVTRPLSSRSSEEDRDVSQEADLKIRARTDWDLNSERQRPPAIKKGETLMESSSSAVAMEEGDLPIDPPQPEVRKISPEMSRIFSLHSPKILSVDHDSDSISADIKKWDDVIGKEYDFNMKVVNDLAQRVAHGRMIKKDNRIMEVLSDLRTYCSTASWYTRQKVCEARAQPLMIKPAKKVGPHAKKGEAAVVSQQSHYALHVDQNVGLKKTQTSSDLMEMIPPAAYMDKYRLLKRLRECLYYLEFDSDKEIILGKEWCMDFKRLVLRLIEHMFEFGAITPNHLNWFFDNKKVIDIVGRHISNLFPHEFSAYGVNRECFAPDLDYLTITSIFDHLYQCLPVLKRRVRRRIIHRALCENYHLFQLPAGYKPSMPELDQIISFVADETFLEKLSNWKPNSDKTSELIDTYVAQLIKNFVKPEIGHGGGTELEVQPEFMINFHLLRYIALNRDTAESMRELLNDEAEYEELLCKLELFVAGKISSVLVHNWSDASNTINFQNKFGLSNEKLEENVKRLKERYSELMETIEASMAVRGVDSWKQNPIIKSILQVFTQDLDKLAGDSPQAPTASL